MGEISKIKRARRGDVLPDRNTTRPGGESASEHRKGRPITERDRRLLLHRDKREAGDKHRTGNFLGKVSYSKKRPK